MDYKEKNKKYNNIISSLNEKLEGLVGRLQGDIDRYNDKNNPISSSAPPSCGSMQKNAYSPGADMTTGELEDLQDAQNEVDSIIEDLAKDKINFPEGSSIIPNQRSTGATGGMGQETGMIKVPFFGRPKWFNEIEAGVGEMFGEPVSIKKGIDYESAQTYLDQKIFISRRPRVRSQKQTKQIYIVLDTSASMKWYKYKGIPFLQLLGSFVPTLAQEYDGEFWVCDACSLAAYDADPNSVPGRSYRLQDMRAAKLQNEIPFKGSGSTYFGGAFKKLLEIEETKKKENPDFEMCVLFFSDMELFDWDEVKRYQPSRVMYITPKSTEKYLAPEYGWIYNNPNNRVILIDLNSDKN